MVERHMAPISLMMDGLVLDYEYYGSHLNENKETIDAALEKRNFGRCGSCLAAILSQGTIDGYIVIAKYIEPIDKSLKTNQFTVNTEQWKAKHVRHGRFTLVISKCIDTSCCGEWRSNAKDILPANAYPAPVYYTQCKGITSLGRKHKDPGKKLHYAHFSDVCTLSTYLDHSSGFYEI